MQIINPRISGVTPEYDFVTAENKFHRMGDYEIELPTGGWCRLPYESANEEDKNGVMIGFRNQHWTEHFHIIRFDLKDEDILYKESVLSCGDLVEIVEKEAHYRAERLFVPENETVLKKGSFSIEKRLFDFMLTGGKFDEIIRRRFFCMCYPEGNWLGPAFFAEHLVEINKNVKIDILKTDTFTSQAINIILKLRKIRTCL